MPHSSEEPTLKDTRSTLVKYCRNKHHQPNNMKTILLALAGALLQTHLLLAATPSIFVPPLDNPRDRLFDEGWLFHRGDAEGAEAPRFADAGWRKVSLPHDWSEEPLPADTAAAGFEPMAGEWR
jgi:hypothetical protein